ncbi:hypothetical protein E4T42_04215 [Aureobasidium subglaciale]|nr:hypothetical protein E4T42_04215 [Aureobasidium subglaciale]
MDELVDKAAPEAIVYTHNRFSLQNLVKVNARLEYTADISARKFQTLLREKPRFNFCIHVDADVLEAVIRRGPSLNETIATVDGDERLKEGYVNLTRADKNWSWDEYDPATFNRRDEGYEEDQNPLDEN